MRRQDVRQQISGAKRTVSKTNERRAPFFDCICLGAVAINRLIDQKARLLWLVNLLHQSHAARNYRQSKVARAFHGGAPNWFGEHVITDGGLIAAIDWLQINDRVILRAVAFRPDFESGITAAAHRLDELVALVRPHAHAETDALNARIMARQIELVHEPGK